MLSRSAFDVAIAEDIASFFHSPLQFIYYCWPGIELRTWQIEYFQELEQILAYDPYQPIQLARASGHGIGKGTCGALLAYWALSTFEMCRGVATANTDTQLRTKTWPEMTKWHSTAINKHWFEITATAIYHKKYERNWRIDAVPWSENNTEAFAGLHNEGKRIIIWFDEASAIHPKVWEVTEGALTDAFTEIIWAANGNPTRTTGRFRDCFGRFKHRWRTGHIDSRTVEGTNKQQLQRICDDYGEDSDVARIRVRGLFPRASALQFIDHDIVEQASQRSPVPGLRDPLIMSVDVARGGSDEYVIAYRRGLDATSIPWIAIPGSEARDSMKVIAKIVDLATNKDMRSRPDAIFVDETGIGGPIVDRLKQLLGDEIPVYGVMFSGASPDPKLANMRMYIWWQMRESLNLGLCIPNDEDLKQQLEGPEYTHDRNNRVLLEDKDEMKIRLGYSPDRADALAIGYALRVAPRDNTHVLEHGLGGLRNTRKKEHDPMSGWK